MGSVVLISTVAILVAIVGCVVIWRMDAARAEEIEHTPPPDHGGDRAVPPASPRHSLDS